MMKWIRKEKLKLLDLIFVFICLRLFYITGNSQVITIKKKGYAGICKIILKILTILHKTIILFVVLQSK